MFNKTNLRSNNWEVCGHCQRVVQQLVLVLVKI